MFERYNDRARQVVVLAQEESKELQHNYIGTEHILLGLIREGEGVAAKALESLGVTFDNARERVVGIIGLGSSPATGHIPFTPRAKKVLELALREALQLGHNYIGTEHILLGLIREGEGVGAQVLIELGADLARVRQQVIMLLENYTAPRSSAKEVVLTIAIERLDSSVELMAEGAGEPREIIGASVTFRDSTGVTVTRRLSRKEIQNLSADKWASPRSLVTVTASRTARGLQFTLAAPRKVTFTIIAASLANDGPDGLIYESRKRWPSVKKS